MIATAVNFRVISQVVLFAAMAFTVILGSQAFGDQSVSGKTVQLQDSRDQGGQEKVANSPWSRDIQKLQQHIVELKLKKDELLKVNEDNDSRLEKLQNQLNNSTEPKRQELIRAHEALKQNSAKSFLDLSRVEENWNSLNNEMKKLKRLESLYQEIEKLKKESDTYLLEIRKTEKILDDLQKSIILSKIQLHMHRDRIDEDTNLLKNNIFKDDINKSIKNSQNKLFEIDKDLKVTLKQFDSVSLDLTAKKLKAADTESFLKYKQIVYEIIEEKIQKDIVDKAKNN